MRCVCSSQLSYASCLAANTLTDRGAVSHRRQSVLHSNEQLHITVCLLLMGREIALPWVDERFTVIVWCRLCRL